MKITFRNRQPFKWRIDQDGALRITMCILKEGVYGYGPDEVPGVPELQGLDEVREFIPAEEFTPEAIASAEGKSIVVDEHAWRYPENALRDGLTVGSVAGTPYVEGDELLCDAIILDPSTIQAITDETLPPEQRLVEVSAGYDGELVVESGSHNGRQYDAKQTNLRFNHVLLLPAGKGRCGSNVRIINQTKTEAKMAGEKQVTLKVQIGNTSRTFRFSNEEDQREAENMLNEERQFNAEQLQASMDAKRDLEGQIAELQKQLKEHDDNLSEAKKQIEELLSAEAQEALATEAAEQGEDEAAIIEAEVENEGDEPAAIENSEEEKEKICNSIRVTNGKRQPLAVRRKNMVNWVMKQRGAEVPATWTQDAYDAAFETMAMQARMQNSKRKTPARVVNGKPTKVENGQPGTSGRERMLRPMKIKNQAKEARNG